jgi:hypothetical protein
MLGFLSFLPLCFPQTLDNLGEPSAYHGAGYWRLRSFSSGLGKTHLTPNVRVTFCGLVDTMTMSENTADGRLLV